MKYVCKPITGLLLVTRQLFSGRVTALGSSGSGLTNNLQHHIKSSTFIFTFSIGKPGRTSNEFPACSNTCPLAVIVK
jgi:hypothetical protein